MRILLLLFIGLMGCTEAEMAKIGALGNAAKIKCYSGGVVIYEGRSTGKVSSEANSDGYFFRDADDQRLKEVSGNCVITYD